MKFAITKSLGLLILSASLSGCNLLDGDDEDEMKNTAPQANTSEFSTEADIPITDSVTAVDADQDTLTYEVDSDPQNGSLSLSSDGQFTYTPASTFTGSDTFSFSVSDGKGGSDTAMVMITVVAQQVSFASYSRAVFSQNQRDLPLPVNGREFTQDVEDPDAYDDLLINP